MKRVIPGRTTCVILNCWLALFPAIYGWPEKSLCIDATFASVLIASIRWVHSMLHFGVGQSFLINSQSRSINGFWSIPVSKILAYEELTYTVRRSNTWRSGLSWGNYIWSNLIISFVAMFRIRKFNSFVATLKPNSSSNRVVWESWFIVFCTNFDFSSVWFLFKRSRFEFFLWSKSIQVPSDAD